MLREIKGSDKNSQLYQRIKLGELCDRIPAINEKPVQKLPVKLKQSTQTRLRSVEEALAASELANAAEIVEASYKRSEVIAPGVYEHNILLAPLINKFATSKEGMAVAVHNAEEAGFWFQDCPENPFSAALFALAVHQLGFEQPSINWLPDADDETPPLYDQCVEHMKQVMDESEVQHGDHWFWQWASFFLSISDYRGHKDLWGRFDRALQAQPECEELWDTMAIRLLPRWHGEKGDLSKLSRRAWVHSRKRKGVSAYLTVFRTANYHENGDHELKLLDDVADLLIEQYSKSADDFERTLVVSALASKGQHDKAAKLLADMSKLHAANWLCDLDPRWIVGLSEIHRPANTLAA